MLRSIVLKRRHWCPTTIDHGEVPQFTYMLNCFYFVPHQLYNGQNELISAKIVMVLRLPTCLKFFKFSRKLKWWQSLEWQKPHVDDITSFHPHVDTFVLSILWFQRMSMTMPVHEKWRNYLIFTSRFLQYCFFFVTKIRLVERHVGLKKIFCEWYFVLWPTHFKMLPHMMISLKMFPFVTTL